VSTAVVPAPRERIWSIVSDPEALAALTPMVHSIERRGQFWRWSLSGLSAFGVTAAPSFTERMRFSPMDRIEFEHSPPLDRAEMSGVDGVYELAAIDVGTTRLHIDITMHLDLPIPALGRRAVERIMASTMQRTGDGFADNLSAALEIDPATIEILTPRTA
jgi:carbon monoxide dehydrogenase subunit G